MLRQLLVGLPSAPAISGSRSGDDGGGLGGAANETPRQLRRLIAVMIATVSVLMAAHVCEVIVWALAYAIVGAAPAGADLLYFAFVNYTTLGYGDVTPVARWRLLGPMTAMNGVLLFGWSTAGIFEVLRRTRRLGGAAPGPKGGDGS
jgi:hypothetical protein